MIGECVFDFPCVVRPAATDPRCRSRRRFRHRRGIQRVGGVVGEGPQEGWRRTKGECLGFSFFCLIFVLIKSNSCPLPVPPQQVEEGVGWGRQRCRAADDATTELVADEGLAATPSTSLAAPDLTINPRMSRLTPLFPKTPSPVGRPPMPPRRRGNVARLKGWDAVEWRAGKWGGLGWDARGLGSRVFRGAWTPSWAAVGGRQGRHNPRQCPGMG